jgi:Domain of unknown function (DUF5666)
MGKKIGLIIGLVIAVLAIGAGSFYGGTVYAAAQVTNTRAAFFNGRAGTGTGGAGGANGAGGGVSGTVKSIDGNTIQVSTALSVTTVTLNSATNVLQSVTASAGDLQVGQQVTVRGQRDSAGNVTATTIQVVPAGATFGGPSQGPAAGATPTP